MAIKLGQPLRRDASGDVPDVNVPSDPGVRIPPNSFGQREAATLSDVGEAVQQEANTRLAQQAQAQARIQDRQDQIQVVRGARDFNQTTRAKLLEISETEDISLQETQTKFRSLVQSESTRVAAGFKGSPLGQEKMKLRLEELSNDILDESSTAAEKEQRRVLAGQIEEDITAQVDIAQGDPTMLEQSLLNIDRIMIDNSNVLTPEQEDAFRADGQSQVYEQTINTNIFQSSLDEALDLLNSPGARRALGPDKVFKMRTRIKKAQDSKDDDPGLQDKVDEINGILGPDEQLSSAEIKELGGLKGNLAKRSDLEKAVEMIKSGEEFGLVLSSDQKKNMMLSAMGVKKTPGQLGDEEAEQQIAKTAALRKAGELPAGASDLIDESGNLKNEVSNSISARVAESMGGFFNSETSTATGLTPEQSQLLPALAAEAGGLILNGTAKDINEAIKITMAGKDIPKPVTFVEASKDIIQSIETPTDQSIAADAANFDKVDLNNATGAASAIVDVFGRTLGQVSNDFVDIKNREDRNRLKMLAHEFILANKRSDRLPVFEQKRLEAIFGGPGVLESGEAMRATFRSLDDQLTEDLVIKQKMLAIDGIPGKEKQEILMDISTMSRFQKKLRTFDMTPGGSDTVEVESAENVAELSDDDFNKFMRSQTEASLNALDDETFAAVKARGSGGGTEKNEGDRSTSEVNEAQLADIKELNDEQLAQFIASAKKSPDEFGVLIPALEDELKSRQKGKK